MKVRVHFEFDSLEEAKKLVDSVVEGKAALTIDDPQQSSCRYAVETESQSVEPVPPQLPPEMPPIEPTQPDTKPLPRQRGGITGVAVKKALNEYKAANGHAKYKEILNYFGASSQRDIAKSDYPAVMQMIEQSKGNVIIADDMNEQTSAVPPQQVAEAMMPVLPQQAPVATAEDIMRALGDHKARWGMAQTQAALQRFGYPNPNDIPESEYGSMIEKLMNDNPIQAGNDSGYDLSAF